ncbi:MAG TPA: hypothetical protein VMF06_23830 [Candidatus Limnocylindria bacterium]|jgi:hypothetical protein|nr:hypothetical protein [Candidatus Limnocylindria bacterium]
MNTSSRWGLALVGTWFLTAFPLVTQAVVFANSGDPAKNTTAPTGNLTDSGWQYLGIFDGVIGTPISPHQFIEAKHVGGNVGDSFVFNGVTYTTTSVATTGNNDLAIWTVSGTLPYYAPLYTGSQEGLYDMVFFGRGASRGAEFRLPGATDADNLRGWLWNTSQSGVTRWGTNVFAGVFTPSAAIGQTLYSFLDRSGGADIATVASGDSGGPAFINVGGTWQLAGITYAVESPFRTNSTSTQDFNAAVFDVGGLYTAGSPNNNLIVADQSTDVPSFWLSSRLSANSQWIYSTIPESSTWVAIAFAGFITGGVGWRRFLKAARSDK